MGKKIENGRKTIKQKSGIVEYLFLNLVVLLGLVLILKLYDTNIFRYPLQYRGDAIQTIYGNRLLADTWLFGFSDRVSYPYYAYMSDFPNSGLYINTVRACVFGLINSEAFAINLVYIMGYFLAASTAYWSFCKLEINKLVAGTVAVLYTFLPFHFMRGISHLTIGMYWPVPIFMYFLINYLKGNVGYKKGERGYLTKDTFLHIVILLVLGGHSIYYTYFSCFFICVAIVVFFVKRERWIIIKQALIDLCILLGNVALTVLVYIINVSRYGANDNVAVRRAAEIENYGLKLGQLLMPVTGHRLSFLADWKNKYNSLPLTTENHIATLGILFSIGFIFLVLELVKKTHKDEDLFACSVLNIAALLLATIGGAASIIATFFAQIRCYNRISIFIAFLAAVSFAKLLNWFVVKLKGGGLRVVVCFIVLAIGLFDQTTETFASNYEKINAEWDSDHNFISCIENMEGDGAQIYQMPYVYYPESGGRESMGSYDLAKGYIHSESLVWSFGAYKGRDGDAWNLYVSSLDLEQQIKVIFANGFEGIYVDSYGYTEEEFLSLAEELARYTGFSPIISENERLYYFSLCNYELEDVGVAATLKVFPKYKDGIYDLEINGDERWNWCQSNALINIANGNDEDYTGIVSMDIIPLETQGSFEIEFKVNGDLIGTESVIGGERNTVTIPITLKSGNNELELNSNIPVMSVNGDSRKLAFQLENFRISNEPREQIINCEQGAIYTFGIDGNSAQLLITKGFSDPEDGYTWTEGNEVEIYCNFGNATEVECLICQQFQITATQTVEVQVGGKTVFNDTVIDGEDISFSFECMPGEIAHIKILLPDAASPFELGRSEDKRELAIAVQSISFLSKTADMD